LLKDSEMQDFPEHWADIPDDEKVALLEMARGRIFWRQFWDRLGWLKSLGTVFLTLAAAATLGRDAVLKWLGIQ
jgi:hypothetical protein